MSLQREIMGGGVSAEVSKATVGSILKSGTATGTTQATALPLGAAVNFLNVVPAGSGVQLPPMLDSDFCIIFNKGANILLVYPPLGLSIDGQAANLPVSISVGAMTEFWGSGSYNYTSAGISAAQVSFLQSGTGAVATTAQDQLRKIVFRSNYDTLAHYNTAKAASSARVFLDPHQDTNYSLGDGSADGALNIYSQITSSNDIVLAAAGAADIHVGNVTGGTGVFFIDTDIRVAPWGNGSRGHGLRVQQNDGSASIEFPSSGGIIEVGSVIRGANGANKDLIFRNGSAAGQWLFNKSDNSAAILKLSNTGAAQFGATPSFVISPDADIARLFGGGSASGMALYPNQTGTGTGGFFRFNNNGTDDQIHFQVLATAGIASVNHLQVTGAISGANPSIKASAENLLFGSGSALLTTATAGYVMFPSCAGTPTGVPTGQAAGKIPMIFDTTGVKLWFYTGGAWKGVVVA